MLVSLIIIATTTVAIAYAFITNSLSINPSSTTTPAKTATNIGGYTEQLTTTKPPITTKIVTQYPEASTTGCMGENGFEKLSVLGNNYCVVAGVKQFPYTDPGRTEKTVKDGYYWFENNLLRIIIPRKAEVRGDEIVVPLSAKIEGKTPVYIHANYIEYVINKVCYFENGVQKCIYVNKSLTYVTSLLTIPYVISEKCSWLLENHSVQDQFIYWPQMLKGIASLYIPRDIVYYHGKKVTHIDMTIKLKYAPLKEYLPVVIEIGDMPSLVVAYSTYKEETLIINVGIGIP